MRAFVAAIVLAGAGFCAPCFGQDEPATEAAPTTQPAVAKAPQPNVVPLTWEFKIDLDDLRSIRALVPGEKGDKLFWYLRYTVTNDSGDDHVFVPEFLLYTGTGQLLRSGKGTATTVFNAIKNRHNEVLLKTQTAVTGKLLQGEDNAKSSVAIWPDFDPNAGVVDIFIGGLSGETAAVDLPEPVKVPEIGPDGKLTMVSKDRILLAKTLHLHYEIPGEAAHRGMVRPKLVRRQWVMR